MRTFAALGLASSFVVALSACERPGDEQPPANAPASSQTAAPEAAPPVTIDLSESDSGAALDVDRGTTLVVRLPANPTTGYSWSLVTSGSVLQQGEPTFVRDAAADNRVGAGGTESWSFTAQQSGEQELRFEYRRAWEREQPPAKSVNYVVRVR